MNSTRHKLTLKWRNKLVIAPRKFVIDNDRIRYFHIVDSYCTFVQLYDHLRYINNNYSCVQVAKANLLKLHSSTKGLYFNYSYWVSNEKKKIIRVYICE